MYRERIQEAAKGIRWSKVQAPCPERKIREAEEIVGFPFPEELKALLRETDGDRYLLLSAEQIMETVKIHREILVEAFEDREEYQEKVDRHIFFATNGCGDYYCYRVRLDGTVEDTAIYLWEHEDFSVREVAKDLVDLIEKYYNDEI